MLSERCLYTLIYAEREHHEEILGQLVTPLVREIRDSPELDSLFFVRFNVPRWQVRFRILGRSEWVEGRVRPLVKRRLLSFEQRRLANGHEFATYQREYERYGGEEGMRLAEKVFFHDSLASLALMEAERKGLVGKSRREISLVLTEKLLDLMRFDTTQRIAFQKLGYRWAIDLKSWDEEDFKVLDRKYQSLREGLAELLYGEQSQDAEAQLGGEVPARIVRTFLDSVRPVIDRLLETHAEGRIPQDLVYLAWSYTHMLCNRLGIDPTPEAILRYFMHRLLLDRPGAVA